jgi:hypothetical protein
MGDIQDIIEKLWENSGHGTRRKDLESAWNCAIREAVALVREKYDEQEPWLEPEDMEQLYVKEGKR